MREIVLDSETTGLDPSRDRIVEIAAVEIVDGQPTGETFHRLVNPQRSIDPDAQKIHGHSLESLRDKPVFAVIVNDLMTFVGDAVLVAHNAEFDRGFLNAELARLGWTLIGQDRVVDTLALARKKHPGKTNTLDALCDRYHVSRMARVKHGALLDAELLADVYRELLGSAQATMTFDAPAAETTAVEADYSSRPARTSLLERIALEAHAIFVSTLGETAIWRTYLP